MGIRLSYRLPVLTKKSPQQETFFVAEPGLEPRQTEPESVVLPLHNSAKNERSFSKADAKVLLFFYISKKIFKKMHFFFKIVVKDYIEDVYFGYVIFFLYLCTTFYGSNY